jgi:hypothetical protein
MEGVGLDMYSQIPVIQSQVVGRQSIEYHAHSPFAIPTSNLYPMLLKVVAAGMVASWQFFGEFTEVQSGTPRRCSIGSAYDGIHVVGGTSDSLGFGSELHRRACQLQLCLLQVPLGVQALPIVPLTFLPMITARRTQCRLQHTSYVPRHRLHCH